MLDNVINTEFYKDKNILITGGTGTIGNIITKYLLEYTEFKKLLIFSRDEFKQYNMKQKFKDYTKYDRLRFCIGDIRDIDRLKFALEHIDIVFHAASLKQVDSIEYNPFEAVKTNIMGTQNVIDACIYNNVKLLVGISTDKAVSPVNLYGGTKLCLEKLIVLSNYYNGGRMKTCILRYGNVVGSRGSVIPLFLKQENFFTVTSDKMTRFSITEKEACNFILNCASICEGGEIFVPKLKKYNILQLCKLINPNNDINIIGIRQGEKFHEEMICESESLNCWENDNIFIIKNQDNPSDNLINTLELIKKNDIFSYNSNNAESITDEGLTEQINTYR